MGSFSDYWENKILDHIFGKVSYTPPVIYVGLSTADPTDNGSGLSEPSGNGYARVQTSVSDWNASANGSLNNASNITFSQATGNWGTITHFALFDAATTGNMLAHGTLSQSKTIGELDTVRFDAGDLNISLD
jgi:hypothetical protein